MTMPVFIIARNEFLRVVGHPVVILVGIIMLVLTVINGCGGLFDLQQLAAQQRGDGFIFGFSQIWYVTTFVCTIMVAYLGVTTISEERWNSSVNVLLVKPLYRRDFIIGKFIGLGALVLLFIIIIMFANTLTLLYFYGSPASCADFLMRISAYIILMWMDCALVLSLMLLVGALCRDFLLAASIAVTYISLEFFWNTVTGYISLILNVPVAPYMLAMRIFYDNPGLFNSSVSLYTWFSGKLPYIALLFFLIVIVLLANCMVFTKREDL